MGKNSPAYVGAKYITERELGFIIHLGEKGNGFFQIVKMDQINVSLCSISPFPQPI
jgi:hypothetical protein